MNSEEYALQIFADYKWDDDYKCTKCGHSEYKKGGKPYSRRCKSCDRDESVQVGTAFEGIKLSADKIYAIVQHIWEHCTFDHDEKNILLRKRRKQNDDIEFDVDQYGEDEMVSVNELLKRWNDGEIKEATVNRLLGKNHAAHHINIAQIARDFEIEENTVNLLLSKISNRLSHATGYESCEPADEVFDFIANKNYNLDTFMGLLLYPLDETWRLGKRITKDGGELQLHEPFSGNFRWRAI